MRKHRDADVLINFASLRSAFESTIDTMNYPQVMGLWNRVGSFWAIEICLGDQETPHWEK